MPIGTTNAASAVSTDSVSGRWLGLLIPTIDARQAVLSELLEVLSYF
jgi:hypothetical protein